MVQHASCLVREERVELSTFGSGGRRSIQLSYSRTGRLKIGQLPGHSNLFRARDPNPGVRRNSSTRAISAGESPCLSLQVRNVPNAWSSHYHLVSNEVGLCSGDNKPFQRFLGIGGKPVSNPGHRIDLRRKLDPLTKRLAVPHSPHLREHRLAQRKKNVPIIVRILKNRVPADTNPAATRPARSLRDNDRESPCSK